jgi:malate dehydrogenase (oxaloacetate-decarboxylating)(NADP+)
MFRGALDTRSVQITDNMKLAAARALANLAREPVPDEIKKLYNKDLTLGIDYIIPTPFDPRLLCTVAPAVAKAAIDDGVAHKNIDDWEKYKEGLRARVAKPKL